MAEEALLAEPHHHAVVEQEPVLVAHQPVAAATDRQRRHHAGVEQVEELARIRPLHQELAERRGVQQPDPLAGVRDLPRHRRLGALAALPVAERPPPVADRLPLRAVGVVPAVDRRLPRRLEERPPRLPGQRPEAHRRIGRPEGRRPHLRDRPVACRRQHRQPVDVRELPLVGRHPERGVALGMLDAGIALPRRQLDVRNLDVVLEVEKRLRPELRARARRHHPHRLERRLLLVRRRRRTRPVRREAQRLDRTARRAMRLREPVLRPERARRRPGGDHEPRPVPSRGGRSGSGTNIARASSQSACRRSAPRGGPPATSPPTSPPHHRRSAQPPHPPGLRAGLTPVTRRRP